MDVYSPSGGDDAWPPSLPAELPAGSREARAQPPLQASSRDASGPSSAGLPAAPSGGSGQLEAEYGAPAGGGRGDAAAAAVAAQLAASGGVSVLLEALSNMPQVRGCVNFLQWRRQYQHCWPSIPVTVSRIAAYSVWQAQDMSGALVDQPPKCRTPKNTQFPLRIVPGPPCLCTFRPAATALQAPLCCGGQDMQQRIGVDLSHIIQPGDAAVPGSEVEYDPEQGGAF